MVTQAEIQNYVRTLRREFLMERVVLFGSYARGSANEDSDVDLLVIMDHDKPRNVDQAITLRLAFDASFPMDLIVKRPKEITARLQMNDTFIRSIIEDGKVLHEQTRH
jgi:predicted nucleotidyltransferase